VWGQLIAEIGSPADGVKWIHVCDRGADDYEVLLRAQRQQCSWVIRVAHLNRKVTTSDGRTLQLHELLNESPVGGTREVEVTASHDQQPRTAQCEVRWSQVGIPIPSVTNAWIREYAPPQPLPMWVIELREVNPPTGSEAIRWVLYTAEEVNTLADAERVVRYYELRWSIEDFHKALKTGCQIESRNYQTSTRLERVLAFSSVVAIRLLRFRTAAKKTPQRPARELAPQAWLAMLRQVRRIPTEQE
jgi:Transposase DDE domain